MKQFLLGLGIVLFCGSTTSAANWNCKDGNQQFNIFHDKLVLVGEDGNVSEYTCRAGYCVSIKIGVDIWVNTKRIFYEKSDTGAWIKPKEFLSSSFLRLNNKDIWISPTINEVATPFTNCEKL